MDVGRHPLVLYIEMAEQSGDHNTHRAVSVSCIYNSASRTPEVEGQGGAVTLGPGSGVFVGVSFTALMIIGTMSHSLVHHVPVHDLSIEDSAAVTGRHTMS